MVKKDLIIKEASYLLENNQTLRNASNVFKRSKTSIYNDLTNKLQYINYDQYQQIKKLFQNNRMSKHIKGGESTKRKYKS